MRWVFISIILIVIMTMVMLALIYFSKVNNAGKIGNSENVLNAVENSEAVSNTTEAAEATLLASGLSIIGIAITVWAGLNIINVLEKKEVDACTLKLNAAEEKLEKLGKRSIEMEESLADIETLNGIYYNIFLQEILKTGKDSMSNYFYKEFSEKKEYRKSYIMCLPIEQIYAQVYLQYGERSRQKKQMIEKAEKGIELIKVALKNEENEKLSEEIKRYLCFRQTMFYFMIGYMKNRMERFDSFLKAANGFKKNATDSFSIKLPGEQGNKERNDQEENLIIKIYFLNVIGESYSKLVHEAKLIGKTETDERGEKITEERLEEYSNQSILYLSECVKLSQNTKEREVFYRNLGCAYERKDRLLENFGKHANEIINSYKQAFRLIMSDDDEVAKRIQNVYHTLLSYYESYIQHGLRKVIETFFETEEERKAFTNKIGSQANKASVDEEQAYKYVPEYQKSSEFAVADHTRFTLQRILNGMAWTWVVMLLLNNEKDIVDEYPEDLEYYMEKIKDSIDMLKIMQLKNDNYFECLQKRYTILEKYKKIKER